jgi:hypothetical protein
LLTVNAKISKGKKIRATVQLLKIHAEGKTVQEATTKLADKLTETYPTLVPVQIRTI